MKRAGTSTPVTSYYLSPWGIVESLPGLTDVEDEHGRIVVEVEDALPLIWERVEFR